MPVSPFMQTVDSLNQGFAISSRLRFAPGINGLLRAVITTPQAEAHLYLHGANLTHYQPVGQRPMLFLSARSYFEPDKPIRGGVPICFPWFGPKPDDPSAPMHGTARLREWTVESAHAHTDGAVTLTLLLPPLRYRVTVSTELTLSLEVFNSSSHPLPFEEAFHSYFAVADCRQIAVRGLENADYLDKVAGYQPRRQGAEPLRITGETDRIYPGHADACTIEDPVWSRRILIEKSGSNSTVVWNPWIEKAKALPDFGDDEWLHMICIETCNVRQDAVTLGPGQTHEMTAVIRSTPLPPLPNPASARPPFAAQQAPGDASNPCIQPRP